MKRSLFNLLMFLEGQIIEFLDVDQLRPGYVRKQERDRLQVVDPRGRNLSMAGDRVVIVHGQSSERDFPIIARGILEKVQERKAEVDVQLLWESLGGLQREFASTELAELFFSESSPEAASAVFRALSEDTLFFKRNGAQFSPKTAVQVTTEQTRRNREREREDARDKLTRAISQLVSSPSVEVTTDLELVLDRLQNWLRHKNNDEVGALLEQSVGPNRARDVAYDILARVGKVDPTQDRFLISAGIDGKTFPAAVLAAAEGIQPGQHTSERRDYRATPAFTIDDEDTREVDDAITLRIEGKEYVVGIHIADVSAFVSRGDAIDQEASRRSSTIYLPSQRVRMLPERLSTDLCSLREGFDRLAYTIEVRFDEELRRTSYNVALTTIHIGKRLTYDDVDALIAAGDPMMRTLYRIAQDLQKERAARGAITVRRPELKLLVEDGNVSIRRTDPNAPSRVLVSEMMILMNGLAADFAAANSLPVIFRTQEPREALSAEDLPANETLAFDRLRKTFKRSRLSLSPGLHSGLGLTAYTQASSPIRRYADLITQRQFTAWLRNQPMPHSREELLRILTSAEATEAELRVLEDRSNTYWLIRYLLAERTAGPMQALVLDRKGNAEIEEFYLRGKLVDPGSVTPGEVIRVTIDHADAVRGDIRLRRA
jgi:exoribonuclease-2